MSICVIQPVTPVAVHQMQGSKWWLTLDDYTLLVQIDGVPGSITIPAGYRYDRASILDFIEWFISKDDLGCVAPLFHDAIYRQQGIMAYHKPETPRDLAWSWPKVLYTRAEADELLYQVCLADGVKPWKAKLSFWAVRIFGSAAWR